ncbi:MAG: hypothetical protein WBA22_11850 [Candidatus Methanofastidiosia archaeon]
MNSSTKWEEKRLKIYRSIFEMIQENMRISYKDMAKNQNHSGRGRSHSTFLQHYKNMIEKRITRHPILILKPFTETQLQLYTCEVNKSSKYKIYRELKEESFTEYVLMLSGKSDILVTSRSDISDKLIQRGLIITEKSKMFTPIFTIPHGKIEETSFNSLLNYEYKIGMVERRVYQGLNFSSIDWRIYNNIKRNGREHYSKISKEIEVDHKTVKSHFENIVLPNCTICHYFFPLGFDFYRQTFMRVETRFETALINAFSELTTTNYIYPVERALFINAFHENNNKFLEVIEKLKEMGIIDQYSFSIPLFASETF